MTPEIPITPSTDFIIPPISKISMIPSSDFSQDPIFEVSSLTPFSEVKSIPQSDVYPIAEKYLKAREGLEVLMNLGHSTSRVGDEEVGGNLVVSVIPLPSSFKLIVLEEKRTSTAYPVFIDTSGVVSDNSDVSFRDYSFNRFNKIVVRKKTKKNESLVMWTSKVVTPEDKAVEAASVIGAFVALNYEQEEEVRKEIHSLRGQVVDLEDR